MNDPLVITAAIGGAATVLSGAIAFLAGSRKSKADAAIVLVGGFKDLMEQLRTQNKQLAASTALVDSERRKRILALQHDCEALEKRIVQLEHELKRNGLEVPNGKD